MKIPVAVILIIFTSVAFSQSTSNPRRELFLRCTGTASSHVIKDGMLKDEDLGERSNELKINEKSIYEMDLDGNYFDHGQPLPGLVGKVSVREPSYNFGSRFIKLRTTIVSDLTLPTDVDRQEQTKKVEFTIDRLTGSYSFINLYTSKGPRPSFQSVREFGVCEPFNPVKTKF